MKQTTKSRPSLRSIQFAAVALAPKPDWGRPVSYGFVAAMSQVPLADTELLLTAHHLPIAIDNIHDDPRVVALTSPRFQKLPVISDKGAWLKGYMPMALRCLPFRFDPARPDKEVLEVATNLEEEQEKRLPMFAAEGALSPEVRQVEGLLQRLGKGKSALRRAAERLLIADVVAPFQLARIPEGQAPLRPFFTVDQNRFAALAPSRAALLVADNFLAVELAVACIFSQRLMATLIELGPANGRGVMDETHHRAFDAFSIVEQFDLRVDDSELFSLERFLAKSRGKARKC